MRLAGKKKWYFPDAEVPPMGADADVYGHESIIILNPNGRAARVEITLYWTNRPPIRGLYADVAAERVLCVRATARDGLMGVMIPEGEQYAIALISDIPIIVQYGRLDVRQSNMAFYTTNGYQER